MITASTKDLTAPDVELFYDPHQRLVVISSTPTMIRAVGGLVRRDLHPALELRGDDGSPGCRRLDDPPARCGRGGRGGAGTLFLPRGRRGPWTPPRPSRFRGVDVDPPRRRRRGCRSFFSRSATSSCISCPAYTIHAVGAGIRRIFTATPREGGSYARPLAAAGGGGLDVDGGQGLRGIGRKGEGQRNRPEGSRGGPRCRPHRESRRSGRYWRACRSAAACGGAERGDHPVLGDQRRYQRTTSASRGSAAGRDG